MPIETAQSHQIQLGARSTQLESAILDGTGKSIDSGTLVFQCLTLVDAAFQLRYPFRLVIVWAQ